MNFLLNGRCILKYTSEQYLLSFWNSDNFIPCESFLDCFMWYSLRITSIWSSHIITVMYSEDRVILIMRSPFFKKKKKIANGHMYWETGKAPSSGAGSCCSPFSSFPHPIRIRGMHTCTVCIFQVSGTRIWTVIGGENPGSNVQCLTPLYYEAGPRNEKSYIVIFTVTRT